MARPLLVRQLAGLVAPHTEFSFCCNLGRFGLARRISYCRLDHGVRVLDRSRTLPLDLRPQSRSFKDSDPMIEGTAPHDPTKGQLVGETMQKQTRQCLSRSRRQSDFSERGVDDHQHRGWLDWSRRRCQAKHCSPRIPQLHPPCTSVASRPHDGVSLSQPSRVQTRLLPTKQAVVGNNRASHTRGRTSSCQECDAFSAGLWLLVPAYAM